MTRKRFVKLLMADGYSRNSANNIAAAARNDGMKYSAAYSAEKATKAALKKLSCAAISTICDAIPALVDAVQKVACAAAEAVEAFTKAFQKSLEGAYEQ